MIEKPAAHDRTPNAPRPSIPLHARALSAIAFSCRQTPLRPAPIAVVAQNAVAKRLSARSPHQLQTHPRGPSFPLSRNASAKSP